MSNVADLKISREKARAKGYEFFFTDKLCSKGHHNKRRVSNGACYACEEWRRLTREANIAAKRGEDGVA